MQLDIFRFSHPHKGSESIQFLSGEYILLGSSPFDRDRLKWIECNLPALNNPGDNLTLQNPVGTVIDSLKYQSNWGGGDGISLERIEFSGASTDPDNWRGCTDSSGHTAGRYNSNSPKQYDLEIKSSFWQPEAPSHNTPVYLNAVILNVGRSTLSGITVEWSAQSCADQHPHRIGIYTIPSLAPKDSATAGIRWNHAMPGSYHLTAAVHHSSDSNLVNNILTDTISISAPALSAVVTEILYNPDDKMSESIELYNRSPHPLELSGWTLTDSDSLSPLSFAVNNYLLPSNHYCVICRDSSAAKANTDSWIVSLILPNLNNTNDLIKLSDANGRMMDSLIYHSEWGGEKGRSLERIHANLDSNDPHNWSTCLHPDGHTLGKVNSNYIPVTSRPVTLTAEPNPFSPNQDGIDDHTIIQYHLSRPAELINLKIYDIQGRLVRFLRNNDKSPIEHYAVWDGKDDSGQRCRMGIYIILLEALNTSGKTIDRKKSTVVLADKL
ncbi:MAG: lamin tail domain-containing protein [candidate division KSB1 bacterium]|nr:lamin tail domain-containing protein [candidate division KSB1 bacterium]